MICYYYYFYDPMNMTILYYLPNDIPRFYQFPSQILVTSSFHHPRGMASCKGKAPQGGHDDIRMHRIGWEQLMHQKRRCHGVISWESIWIICWLVVDPPLLKNMKVSWDDDTPNIWKNQKCSKSPTSMMYHDVSFHVFHGIP